MSNVEAILESIEKLTLIEAAELVKAMEEKFGVSAAAPVAVAAAPAAVADHGGSQRSLPASQPGICPPGNRAAGAAGILERPCLAHGSLGGRSVHHPVLGGGSHAASHGHFLSPVHPAGGSGLSAPHRL